MIYRIQPISLKYQCLHIEGKEARKALGEETDFNLDPSPIAYLDNWKPMPVSFFSDAKGADLIPDIALRVGKLFLSEKAYAVLKEALSPCGEFLPVTYEGGSGYLYNCLTMAEDYEAVDSKLSIHDPLSDQYAITFDNAKLTGIAIFKCNIDLSGLFCNDTVKKLIDSHQLSGVDLVEDIGHPFPADAKMIQTH